MDATLRTFKNPCNEETSTSDLRGFLFMEQWKIIPNYPNYEISDSGNLFTKRTNSHKLVKGNISKSGYLRYTLRNNDGHRTFGAHVVVAMAFLNHTPKGHEFVVDHIDNNKLNNHVSNLQIITQRENSFKTQENYSSKYKGVCYCKQTKKWSSQIQINGNRIHLGRFKSELEANIAYKNKLNELK